MAKLPVTLTIGRHGFYQGKIYKITGTHGPSHWVLFNSMIGNTALSVPKKCVHPVCSDLFTVGDKVQSIFGGFNGEVTGFEFEHNRIICRSAGSSHRDDRTRYAYRVDELVNEQMRPLFVSNKCRQVLFTGEHRYKEVRPLPYHNDDTLLTLYSVSNGRILTVLPRETTWADAAHFGIVNIK